MQYPENYQNISPYGGERLNISTISRNTSTSTKSNNSNFKDYCFGDDVTKESKGHFKNGQYYSAESFGQHSDQKQFHSSNQNLELDYQDSIQYNNIENKDHSTKAIKNFNNQENPLINSYLQNFRVNHCQLFLQQSCPKHKPHTCFDWHFKNQRRRRPYIIEETGKFNYSPDIYCTEYNETSGECPNETDSVCCPYLHRNTGDTERRYHPRYYKTSICIYKTNETTGACIKNGIHCAYAHNKSNLRNATFEILNSATDSGIIHDNDLMNVNITKFGKNDIEDEENCQIGSFQSEMIKNNEAQLLFHEELCRENIIPDDPKWENVSFVQIHYKTTKCTKEPRLCRQGYACPFFHNRRDRRRSPKTHIYQSKACPNVKLGDNWEDPKVCNKGDKCEYCHTRTEQQFHPDIYKSNKCKDMMKTGYCPRRSFCAFSHSQLKQKQEDNRSENSDSKQIWSHIDNNINDKFRQSSYQENVKNWHNENFGSHLCVDRNLPRSNSCNLPAEEIRRRLLSDSNVVMKSNKPDEYYNQKPDWYDNRKLLNKLSTLQSPTVNEENEYLDRLNTNDSSRRSSPKNVVINQNKNFGQEYFDNNFKSNIKRSSTLDRSSLFYEDVNIRTNPVIQRRKILSESSTRPTSTDFFNPLNYENKNCQIKNVINCSLLRQLDEKRSDISLDLGKKESTLTLINENSVEQELEIGDLQLSDVNRRSKTSSFSKAPGSSRSLFDKNDDDGQQNLFKKDVPSLKAKISPPIGENGQGLNGSNFSKSKGLNRSYSLNTSRSGNTSLNQSPPGMTKNSDYSRFTKEQLIEIVICLKKKNLKLSLDYENLINNKLDNLSPKDLKNLSNKINGFLNKNV